MSIEKFEIAVQETYDTKWYLNDETSLGKQINGLFRLF